ncbi:Zn finger protein [Scheffersomyces xylosifermentans]|uniref:Zn finger protein n=1 Tax=Scheffersomyces xylosifermentans TaxID=1304137 RepID=UPI00315CFA1D
MESQAPTLIAATQMPSTPLSSGGKIQPTFTLASPEKEDRSHDDALNTNANTDTSIHEVQAPDNNTTHITVNDNNSINLDSINTSKNNNTNNNTNNNVINTDLPYDTDNKQDSTNSDYIDSPEDDQNSNKFDSSDLTFKKKDVRKSRTTSFQSVLSTASLKSLKQQVIMNNANPSNGTRSASISHNNSNSNMINSSTTSRNFQSFIQAPVLSSVTNLKSDDDIEIGQQLPFDSTTTSREMSSDKLDSHNVDDRQTQVHETLAADEEDDQDIILQQQKLTLNALKKLSLSPMPISLTDNNLTRKPLNRKASIPMEGKAESNVDKEVRGAPDSSSTATSSTSSKPKKEPYQPAEVDLSSFASLTRQPKIVEKFPSPVVENSGIISNSENGGLNSNVGRNNDGNGEKNGNEVEDNNATNSYNNSTNGLSNKSSFNDIKVSRKSSLPSLPEGRRIETPTHEATPIQRSQQGVNQKPAIQAQNQVHAQQSQHQQLQQQLNQQNYNPQPQQYHQFEQIPQQQFQQQLNQQSTQRVPTAVVPPQHMNSRRIPHPNTIPQSQLPPHSQDSPPNNSNIVNPRANRHLQQIKGFRSPMYVPAVLRMTLKNGVSPTISASGSNPTSPNELSTSPKNGGHYEQDHLNLNDSSSQRNGNTRSSSRDSVRSVDSSVSIESTNSSSGATQFLGFLGKHGSEDYIFKAPPTRKHWLKDESVLKCGMPGCDKQFNFFERRHHCRKCGGIYCKEHTSHYLYINHLAQFTTGGRGTLSKVCDVCISEYNEFIQHEFGVSISQSNSQKGNNSISSKANISVGGTGIDRKNIETGADVNANSNGESVVHPLIGKTSRTPSATNSQYLRSGHSEVAKHLIVGNEERRESRSEQLVGSVPANWSWSSF